MPQLLIQDLCKQYVSGQPVLDQLDLEVQHGEWISLLGQSGSGKSTLLHVIAGLLQAERGVIKLDGKPIDHIAPHLREIGFVFQLNGFYDQFSVNQNLVVSLQTQRLSRAEEQARLDWVIGLLDLAPLLQRTPQQLSGGQLQRVALGRGLIRQPKLLLLDEPLNHLDSGLRHRLRREMRALHDGLGMTTLYVTHDAEEAMLLGDRVAVIDSGKILQMDTPQTLYQSPLHRKVIDSLLGDDVQWMAGRYAAGGGDSLGRGDLEIGPWSWKLPSLAPDDGIGKLGGWVGQALQVCVYPQMWSLESQTGNPWVKPAVLKKKQFGARGWRLHATLEGDGPITMEVSHAQGDPLREGDQIWVKLQVERLLAFLPNGFNASTTM